MEKLNRRPIDRESEEGSASDEEKHLEEELDKETQHHSMCVMNYGHHCSIMFHD